MGDRSHYRGSRDRDRSRHSSYGFDHGRDHRSHHDRDRGRSQYTHDHDRRSRPNHTFGGGGDWRSTSPDRHTHRPSRSNYTTTSNRPTASDWERDMTYERREERNRLFTRRSDDLEVSRRTGVNPDVLLKMQRLREYIPYLNKRKREIRKQGRERELEDDMETMDWMLEVITDVNADENFGVDTMHSVHEQLLEMVRKHPILSAFPANTVDEDDDAEEDDDDDDEAPRSPSPPSQKPYAATDTSNPTIIPTERSAPLITDWNFEPNQNQVFEYSHGESAIRRSRTSMDEWERDSQDSQSPADLRRPHQDPAEDWRANFRRPKQPSVVESSVRNTDLAFGRSEPLLECNSFIPQHQMYPSTLGQRDQDMRITDSSANHSHRIFEQQMNYQAPRAMPGTTISTSMIDIDSSDLNLMNPDLALRVGMNPMNPHAGLVGSRSLTHRTQPAVDLHNVFPYMSSGVPGALIGQSHPTQQTTLFSRHTELPFSNQYRSHPMNSAAGLLPTPIGITAQSQSIENPALNSGVPIYNQQQHFGSNSHRYGTEVQNGTTNFSRGMHNAPTYSNSQRSADRIQGNRYQAYPEAITKPRERSVRFAPMTPNSSQPNRTSHNEVPPPAITTPSNEPSVSRTSSTERPPLASNQILADPRLKGRIYTSNMQKQGTPAQTSSVRTQNLSTARNAGRVAHNIPTPSATSTQPSESLGRSNPALDKAHNYVGSDQRDLNTIRERVRSKTAATPKPQLSKLQELRQSFQVHQMLALGPQSKKGKVSFEDALSQPAIEKPVEKKASPKKTTNKDGSQNSSLSNERRPALLDESHKDNQMGKPKEKSKPKDMQTERKRGAEQRLSSTAVKAGGKDGSGRQRRISSPSGNEGKAMNSKSSKTIQDVTKRRTPAASGGFRIPKIKKPEPTVTNSTSEPKPKKGKPAPQLSHAPMPDEDWDDEPDIQPLPKKATKSVELPEVPAVPVPTETLIRDLIARTVSSEDANIITNDPTYMATLIARLQSDIASKLKKASTSADQGATRQDSFENDSSEERESEPVEKGAKPRGRPRTVQKKKGGKRRSSLEKLQDALREMNFDMRSHLGPRSRTSRATQEDTEAPAVSQKGSHNPECTVKDGVKTSTDAQHSLDVVTSPGAKSRKRKRKASTSPKKRGRKSNSQAAKKTRIGKNKIGNEGTKKEIAKKILDKKKRKIRLSRNTAGVVTRSRIGPRDIVVNRGLNKIKLEKDYIPPKREVDIEDDTDKLENADIVPNPIDFTGQSLNQNSMDIDTLFDGFKMEELDIPIDEDFEGKDLLDDFDNNKDLFEDAYNAQKDLLDGVDGNKELMDELDPFGKEGSFGDLEQDLHQDCAPLQPAANASDAQETPTTNTLPSRELLVNSTFTEVEGGDKPHNEPVVQFQDPQIPSPSNVKDAQQNIKKSPVKRGRKKSLAPGTFECHLCDFVGKRIINHYVNSHKGQTNPYSRMPSAVFLKLSEENLSPSPQLMELQLVPEQGNEEDRRWACVLCNEKTETVIEFFDHMTSHTGEFRYACPVCDTRSPFSKSIVTHFKSHRLDSLSYEVPKVLCDPGLEPSATECYCYVCKQCLCIQFLYENMTAHLELEKHSVESVICMKFIQPKPGVHSSFNRSVFIGESSWESLADLNRAVECEAPPEVPEDVRRRMSISERKLDEIYNTVCTTNSTELNHQSSEVNETTKEMHLDVDNTMDWLVSNVEFRKDTPLDGIAIIKKEKEDPAESFSIHASTSANCAIPSKVKAHVSTPTLDLDSAKSESDEEEINDYFCDDSSSDGDTGPVASNTADSNRPAQASLPEISESATNASCKSFQDLSSTITTDEIIKEEDGDSINEYGTENECLNRPTNLKGHDLYRCANEGCNFAGSNSFAYKLHAYNCGFVDDPKQIPCFHCDKRMKSIPTLLEHIKIHGERRQVCGLCSFRCWLNIDLAKHMKLTHKSISYKIIKCPTFDEPDFIMYPKDVASKLVEPKALRKNHMRYSSKAQFFPHEIENIPRSCIFTKLVHCALCSYSTKVRSNILRHLQLHEQANTDGGETSVPSEAPINPVPWLERKELMFDKMTNWAGSSHAKKDDVEAAKDASKLPKFVLDQFRYECSVESCKQITVDDSLLRAHMKALHSEVEFYECPHCHSSEETRNNPRSTVIIDKLGSHLKLHGPQLLKCGICDYIHNQTRVMEKHISEKHPERKSILYQIRNLDSEGNAANSRRPSVDENQKSSCDRWRCGICRMLLISWDEAKNHSQHTHKVTGQFMCTSCNFSDDNCFKICDHVEQHDVEANNVPAIMIMFFKNESNNTLEAKQDECPNHLIWRRDSARVRHIRGIYLDETKEQSLGGVSSPSKAAKLKGLQSQSEETPKLVCPKCELFKTNTPHEMTIHMYNEFRYQRYGCKVCQLLFVTLDSLIAHVMNDHNEAYDELVYLHMEPPNIDTEKLVQDIIEKQTKEIENSINSGTAGIDLVLDCKHCHNKFSAYHYLKTHILAKHIAPDRYKCKYCPAGFWTEGLLKSHHAKSHGEQQFEAIKNHEFEANLTPEFWLKEYGIPKENIRAIVANKRPELVSAGRGNSNAKVSPKRPNITIGSNISTTFGVSGIGKKDNIYECVHCEYKCFTNRGMRSHWVRSHKEDRLPCQYYEVRTYGRIQSGPGFDLRCFYCLHVSTSMDEMKTHHELHHSENEFRLKRRHVNVAAASSSRIAASSEGGRILRTNSLEFVGTSSNVQESSTANPPDIRLIEDKVIHECPFCTIDFQSETEYDMHSLSEHQGDRAEANLKYVRRVLQKKKSGPTLGPKKMGTKAVNGASSQWLGCPECNFTTTNKEALIQKHIKIHIHAYMCPTCAMEFRTEASVRFHLRHEHADSYTEPMESPHASLEYEELQSRIVVIPPKKTKQQFVTKISTPAGDIPVINIDDDDDIIPVEYQPPVYSTMPSKYRQTARKSTGKAPGSNVISLQSDTMFLPTFKSRMEQEGEDYSDPYMLQYDDLEEFDVTYEDPSTYVPGPSNPNPIIG